MTVPFLIDDRARRNCPDDAASIRTRFMGRKGRHRTDQAAELAMALAGSGLYRDVGEMEAAFRTRYPDLDMPADRLMRGLIDGACLRSRKAWGWDP